MPKPSSKVVMLHGRDSERALENLNRITGLRFSSWPESLAGTVDDVPLTGEAPHEPCESPARIGQALA